LLAADLLGLDVPRTDKRLLALVEVDGCFADGVSVATGCWLGRRTLRLVDFGKVAATLVDTTTGKGVRVRPAHRARMLADRYAPRAPTRWHAQLAAYEVMPDDVLLVAEPVAAALPLKDFLGMPDVRVACGRCREEILHGREVQSRGRILCRGCAGEEPFVLPRAASALLRGSTDV
jgi:formylmethanofuran dehydrogenase subunit E